MPALGSQKASVEELVLGDGEDIGDVALLAAADLDADRVGEHQMRHPRRRLDGDFRRDPAAERHAHDGEVVERELVDEVEIEIGEVVDAIERLRRLRAAEAGMGRRQHARAGGEGVEHRRIGLEADAGMQEQERPAAPALDHLDADAVDGDGADRL